MLCNMQRLYAIKLYTCRYHIWTFEIFLKSVRSSTTSIASFKYSVLVIIHLNLSNQYQMSPKVKDPQKGMDGREEMLSDRGNYNNIIIMPVTARDENIFITPLCTGIIGLYDNKGLNKLIMFKDMLMLFPIRNSFSHYKLLQQKCYPTYRPWRSTWDVDARVHISQPQSRTEDGGYS